MKRFGLPFLRRRREIRRSEELVEECGRFISGTLLDGYQVGDCQTVPPWIRLNPLAHGTEGALAVLRAPSLQAPYRERRWDLALSYLVAEIELARAEANVPLAEVQQRVLIPLELAWERQAQPGSMGDPRAFVRPVKAALEQFRTSYRGVVHADRAGANERSSSTSRRPAKTKKVAPTTEIRVQP